MLKQLLLILLSLASGFALSRWTAPAVAENSVRTEKRMFVTKQTPTPPQANLQTGAMEKALADGEWKDFAKKWAQEDPAGFHAWLVRQDPAPLKEVTHLLFETWVLRDPDTAFTAAVNLPRRFQRKNVIPEMLNRLLDAGTHDELAIHWIKQTRGEFSGFGWPNPAFLKSKSPEEAAALLSKVADTFYGSMLITQLGRNWVAKDLEGARLWVAGLPVEMRSAAFNGVVEAWVEKDVAGVLAYLATEASSAERHYTYAPLAKLATTNPQAAFKWWEENLGIPDSNTLRHMLSAWRAKDPEATRSYVLGIEDATLRQQVIKAYVNNDTKTAPTFVMSLPPGDDRNAAAEAIAYSWAKENKESAMAYLVQESDTETGRSVVRNMVTGLAWQNPVDAFGWANEVPEGLREAGVASAIQGWRDKDVTAAAAAVSAMPEGPIKEAATKAMMK